MIKLLKATMLLCLIGLLSACEKGTEATEPLPIDLPAVGNRTVLVYMVAQNTLSSFAVDDFKEILEGAQQLDVSQNNLIVYLDDYSAGAKLILLRKNSVGELTQQVMVGYKSQNAMDVGVMRKVITDAFTRCPAQSYGLVMWSHADGWAPWPAIHSRSFGDDNGKSINIIDLRKVLESVEYLDFLFFDACFMQAVEVAYELRHCTHYIIASPTEIPAPGAPYQSVVSAMFAANDAPYQIARTYYETYLRTYKDEAVSRGKPWDANDHWVAGVSVGVVDCTKLEKLAAATKGIKIKARDTSPAASKVFCYDFRSSAYYYDLDGLIKNMTQGNDEYMAWRSVFDEAVFFQTTSRNYSDYKGSFLMEGAQGLSAYNLRSSTPVLNNFYRTYQWYQDAGWEVTGW